MGKTKAGGARCLALAAALALAGGSVHAAGGHHDVDDAVILAGGQCAQETWFSAVDGGRQRLHAGLNCGVGPVELGVGAEHGRGGGQPSRGFWNLELKWARALAAGFSVGLDVAPVFQSNADSRYAGTGAYAIVTWAARDEVSVHANYGRDFAPGDGDAARGGVALEWSPSAQWSFVFERFRQQRSDAARVGLRWAGGRMWNVDLSRAQRIAGPQPSNWTLGLSFAFDSD